MMTSRVVRVLSGGFLVFLGLFAMPQVSDVASAADQKKEAQDKKVQNKGTDAKDRIREAEGLPCDVSAGQNVAQAEKDAQAGGHLVLGEVTRVDGMTYVIKDESGKEVKLQTDERTEKSPIQQGDSISASVDSQNHALWIRANRGTDRRTEHVAGGCDPS